MITPFVLASSISRPWWAFVLSFTTVFILWCLNYTSIELQNPFGSDANDIDIVFLQKDMNEQLTLICSPMALRTPHVRKAGATCSDSPTNSDDDAVPLSPRMVA